VRVKPRIILCDVDGTVADSRRGQPGRRGPYDWHRVGEDEPIQPIVDLVWLFFRLNWEVFFISGRDEVCRGETLRWLRRHFGHAFPAQALLLRPHGDNRRDSVVKRELYENLIEPYYEVAYVLDDRNQVVQEWRSLGLTVLQVADGDF
jgi:hypothetical protein